MFGTNGAGESQRLAHVRSMTARAAKRAAAGSGGSSSLLGPGSPFGGSGYGGGGGVGGSGGGGSVSLGLPPGLPADSPALARRATLGEAAGAAPGGGVGVGGGGFQRTGSLQVRGGRGERGGVILWGVLVGLWGRLGAGGRGGILAAQQWKMGGRSQSLYETKENALELGRRGGG